MRPPEKAGAGGFHLKIVRTANWPPGNADYIPTRSNSRHPQPHHFAQTPLNAVANHGIANPAVHGKTKTAVWQIVGQGTKHKQITRIRAATLANITKALIIAYAEPSFHVACCCQSAAASAKPVPLHRFTDGKLYGQPGAAFYAAPMKDLTSCRRGHARAETVRPETLTNFGLPGAFSCHWFVLPFMVRFALDFRRKNCTATVARTIRSE